MKKSYIFLTLVIGLPILGIIYFASRKDLSKPLFTPQELSNLMGINENKRSEILHYEKKYAEHDDGSYIIYDLPKEKGIMYFKKRDVDLGRIVFYKREDYVFLKKNFKGIPQPYLKLKDPDSLYYLNKCIISFDGYSKEEEGFLVTLASAQIGDN